MTPMFNVVVTVDPTCWGPRKESDVLPDWIEPLSAHPQIKDVIFIGAVKRFAHLKAPKVRYVPGGADDRELVLDLGCQPGVEGVIRLRHNSKLRFPVSAGLITATIDGYLKNARNGYYQMDLSDVPYPYLLPEVLGKAALLVMLNRSDLPLDFDQLTVRCAGQFTIERGNLPYEPRLEYLQNANVEYFGFPKFMALESSRLCNLRCTMCVTHSDFIDHSHLEKYPKHFDLGKYQWILDQMEPFREHMAIAPQFQGEPFMAPHINEMISYARQKKFCVGFTSNATLWNDEIIDFMIDQEVSGLCVSLDGATKETYERVRIGANFDTVVRNLNRLVERKEQRGVLHPSLAINMTLMPENRHEEEKLLADWLGKAERISINNTCINHVVPEKFHEPERYPCPFLWEGVHILTNGDVIACCRDSDYEEVMGNAYATPMQDIWNGEKYRRFRMLHALKRWNEIPICARCDTWMCKTKKTVGDGNRMVLQYPFYRQISHLANPHGGLLSGKMLEDVWAALKTTTKNAANALISLNPLRSKAS